MCCAALSLSLVASMQGAREILTNAGTKVQGAQHADGQVRIDLADDLNCVSTRQVCILQGRGGLVLCTLIRRKHHERGIAGNVRDSDALL